MAGSQITGVLRRGAHFRRPPAGELALSDVIIGAALGVLSGRAATFELRRRKVSLAPSLAPGGGLLIGGSIQ